jgi:hypothetical protein
VGDYVVGSEAEFLQDGTAGGGSAEAVDADDRTFAADKILPPAQGSAGLVGDLGNARQLDAVALLSGLFVEYLQTWERNDPGCDAGVGQELGPI